LEIARLTRKVIKLKTGRAILNIGGLAARPPRKGNIYHSPALFQQVVSVMRKASTAGVLIFAIGGGATYAWMGSPQTQPIEAPKVETARLFSAANDVSPTPARDLIATKLATIPVTWPDVPKAAPKVLQTKRQAAAKPKKKKQAQTTKKPPTVSGSL
jgi:hypothetical protein